MEAEYSGTVYFDRYVLGRWCKAEGLIYPMYLKAFEEPPEGIADEYGLSIDYGTKNAFAALIWGRYGSKWYAEREYYYSGRTAGISKTDGEYYEDMLEFTKDIHKTIMVIIDPSAASFIAQLRRDSRFRVIPAQNDVGNGIRDTALTMQQGIFKVNPACKYWRTEVEGYVWAEGVEDRPIKVDDHLMDATRYFIKTMRLAQPYIPYKSVLETKGRI
jgi:hypothetical protein